MQTMNDAKFLNVTCLFLLPACTAAESAPALVIVIVPFTGIDLTICILSSLQSSLTSTHFFFCI